MAEVTPCSRCSQGDYLTNLSTGLEAAAVDIEEKSSIFWDTPEEASGEASDTLPPELGGTPESRAHIEESTEKARENMQHLIRIASELSAVISGSLDEAAAIDCDSASTSPETFCPRVLYLLDLKQGLEAITGVEL